MTRSFSQDQHVVIRGGGDLATGVIQKFQHAGFPVTVLEVAKPLAIRRTVALCNAVIEGKMQVEDLKAVRIEHPEQCHSCWQQGHIPILIDPEAQSLAYLQPTIVVDAILAKRNLGTNPSMAPIVIGMGPGFSAPTDVDAVIETMRGHTLGKVIFTGSALPNTGVPGLIGGKSAERVVHAPVAGVVKHAHTIGDRVQKGETLFYLDDIPVPSPLTGVLRGLISEGLQIPAGLKCADVDPRSPDQVDCFTISDKARALGGAVLDAALLLGKQKQLF